MYRCANCMSAFEWAEIKALDAGPIYAIDVMGLVKQTTISVCPECKSEKIVVESIKVDYTKKGIIHH